mgnify:CR=1 FL=1
MKARWLLTCFLLTLTCSSNVAAQKIPVTYPFDGGSGRVENPLFEKSFLDFRFNDFLRQYLWSKSYYFRQINKRQRHK